MTPFARAAGRSIRPKRVKWVCHPTATALLRAFFKSMGAKPEDCTDTEGAPVLSRKGMLGSVQDAGMWAFTLTKPKVPVVHYWAKRGADRAELAFLLGHELGHSSGKRLNSQRMRRSGASAPVQAPLEAPHGAEGGARSDAQRVAMNLSLWPTPTRTMEGGRVCQNLCQRLDLGFLLILAGPGACRLPRPDGAFASSVPDDLHGLRHQFRIRRPLAHNHLLPSYRSWRGKVA